MSTSITEPRSSSAGPPPTASRKSVSPVKHSSSPTTKETPSSEWPGVASASIRSPPVSTGPLVTSSPKRRTSSSLPATWSAWPCVTSRWVGVSPSRSTKASSGSSGAPLSTKTAVPPGSSPSEYAFDSHEGACSARAACPDRMGGAGRAAASDRDRRPTMTTVDTMFEEREVLEEAAGVVALPADRDRVARVRPPRLPVGLHDRLAISILFGVVAIIAGVNEFFAISVSTTGWKIVHGILGVLFVLVGFYASGIRTTRSPHSPRSSAFFLLFRGIFDVTVAFVTKDEFDLWWLQLVAGYRDPARVLGGGELAGQGDPARRLRRHRRPHRGITGALLAFKLRASGDVSLPHSRRVHRGRLVRPRTSSVTAAGGAARATAPAADARSRSRPRGSRAAARSRAPSAADQDDRPFAGRDAEPPRKSSSTNRRYASNESVWWSM